jgi:hypothetical protein
MSNKTQSALITATGGRLPLMMLSLKKQPTE